MSQLAVNYVVTYQSQVSWFLGQALLLFTFHFCFCLIHTPCLASQLWNCMVWTRKMSCHCKSARACVCVCVCVLVCVCVCVCVCVSKFQCFAHSFSSYCGHCDGIYVANCQWDSVLSVGQLCLLSSWLIKMGCVGPVQYENQSNCLFSNKIMCCACFT